MKALLYSVSPTANPCLQHRFLNTHRQVWESPLWSHCSFLLGPGAQKVMCSKLKWTGMGGFNSDDHHIYYCGQESLKRNEVAITVSKRVQNAVLGCNLKNYRMNSVHFQGKPFNISVIQVCAPTNNAEEAELERFYEDLQDLLELTPKTYVLVIIGDWNAKSRKSRNTWNNGQTWPWSTEWSRAKVNRVLPRECTGHSKHPLPTTQEKTTHVHHQMVNTKIRLIIFFAAKEGEALYSQQKQDLWELTGPDHELLIIKFSLKLKKVGKTTRPLQVWPKSNPLGPNSGSDK